MTDTGAETFFDILGVGINATDRDINEAYARKTAEAGKDMARLRKVKEAFATLANPIKREQYRNRILASGTRSGQQPGTGAPPSPKPAAPTPAVPPPSGRSRRQGTIVWNPEDDAPPAKPSSSGGSREGTQPPEPDYPLPQRSQSGKQRRPTTVVMGPGEDKPVKETPREPERKREPEPPPSGSQNKGKAGRVPTEVPDVPLEPSGKQRPPIEQQNDAGKPAGRQPRPKTIDMSAPPEDEVSQPPQPKEMEKQGQGQPVKKEDENAAGNRPPKTEPLGNKPAPVVKEPQPEAPVVTPPPEGKRAPVADEPVKTPDADQVTKEPEAGQVVDGGTIIHRMAGPVIKMVIEYQGKREEFELRSGENLIARPSSNHQKPDIPIVDPFVSREHAVIVVEGDRVWLKDLKSGNGTRLNGRQVTPETTVEITSKDMIEIEKRILHIVIERP